MTSRSKWIPIFCVGLLDLSASLYSPDFTSMSQPKPTPGDTENGSLFPLDSKLDQVIENEEESYLDPSRHDLSGNIRDSSGDDDRRRKRRELFCFHCHRMETHLLAPRFGVIYSFLIGLTLGLVKLIGPYYCRCCSHGRFLGWDQVHPKYWLHQRRLRKHSKARKSRRR